MDWRNTCGLGQASGWRDYATEGHPSQEQPMEVPRMWRGSTSEVVAILAEQLAELAELNPKAGSASARRWRSIAREMLAKIQAPPLPPWGLARRESAKQQKRQGKHLRAVAE